MTTSPNPETCLEPIAGSLCTLDAGHPGKHDPRKPELDVQATADLIRPENPALADALLRDRELVRDDNATIACSPAYDGGTGDSATCSCVASPQPTGPEVDCPIHGCGCATRGFPDEHCPPGHHHQDLAAPGDPICGATTITQHAGQLHCRLVPNHDGDHYDAGIQFAVSDQDIDGTHSTPAHDRCPDCRARRGLTPDPRTPGHPLEPELVEGLTMWGLFGGAQIRTESHGLLDDDGLDVDDDDGHPVLTEAVTCLYIHHRDGAPRSSEDLQPWRLDLVETRQLRDLLNLATARGLL